MRQVFFSTREIVIYYQNIITLFEKLLGQVGSQKACAAGNEDFVHG
jgi:hypothetical protein